MTNDRMSENLGDNHKRRVLAALKEYMANRRSEVRKQALSLLSGVGEMNREMLASQMCHLITWTQIAEYWAGAEPCYQPVDNQVRMPGSLSLPQVRQLISIEIRRILRRLSELDGFTTKKNQAEGVASG